MLGFKTGNLLFEEVEALVNTVNCVGVMGRGIALQFKNAFPENYKTYVAACKRGEVKPGEMFVFETGELTFPRYIINFPTKRHWRGKSRMEDIESGLVSLSRVIRDRHIQSIAIPPLGSGLGGLEWVQVRRRIESALQGITTARIVVFEPKVALDSNKMIQHRIAPKMTEGRAALIYLMHRYLSGLLDPFVTLLEVHKLMFFLQEAGEPLRLNYVKGPYGPYAEELRHVLNRMEGHFILGYADGGDSPQKPLELIPTAIVEAQQLLKKHPETNTYCDRVGDLVEGFESSFGLELLSTVYWVIKKESVHSMEEMIKTTYAWNERKKQFSPRQLKLAAMILKRKGWLNGIELEGIE